MEATGSNLDPKIAGGLVAVDWNEVEEVVSIFLSPSPLNGVGALAERGGYATRPDATELKGVGALLGNGG